MTSGNGVSGLSSHEAAQRLKQHGPNEIRQEKSRAPWVLLAEQFKSSLVLILIFACVLSAVLGEWIEAVAIAAILVLNALIGFFQEYRAENAVLALKNMTAPRAMVVREGKQTVIPARDVVPGDTLVLEAGDIVAADAKIEEASRLQVNEAVLTGESLPVEKDRSGSVFMGTAVATGTARAEVVSTGMGTELGKIAHLITTAESSLTPLQVQLAHVGRMLLGVCLVVVGIVLVLGIVHGRPWLELVIFAVSLAVAAVPEGLPAIVTVALALGVQRMAARNALIRKLPSVETLGSVSVICTDKTGTLTTGNMRVREISGDRHKEVIFAATACCDAELSPDGTTGTGDPTEIAILIAANERGIVRQEIEKSRSRVAVEPFDSVRKRMSIFRQDGLLYVKGAFESVVPLCGLAGETLTRAKEESEDMTSRGLRVLAVAVGKSREERNLSYLGLIGIADPPRTEAMRAIAEARAAGITPIMITGDHPTTAAAIARELGLVRDSETVEGRVYARATPEDKLMLVRAWKEKGAIVAMTGDGVNDAPALREAHIGVAMGKNGTEVTRQSADLILADDNFATIIEAVREGRGVYQNIRKAVVYLLTGNFSELMAVLGASVLGLPIPFLASHLLWINLVTDSLPALALIADPVSPDVMKRPPRASGENLLGKSEWIRIGSLGGFEALLVLGLYLYVLRTSGVEQARNLAFTTLVFSQLWRAFGARSQHRVFFEVGVFNNLWLLGVVAITVCLQLSLHYLPFAQEIFGLMPLTAEELLCLVPYSMVPITLVEMIKLVRRVRK
jgi:Ca2+-transporting ATPase